MENLRKKIGFICDMDGVIYHGNRLLPGVKEFEEWLYRENKRFLFLTNSSERTPRELQQKLARMGLEVDESHFYTSALATAQFIKTQAPGSSAYVIGAPGLYDALYQAGIGDAILMSGDSRSVYYDETGAMRKAAMASGVPEEAILTDPMGLSTYDSVARLLKVWRFQRVVIVTQEYHLYRALYIAEKLGIEAYGVAADKRPYAGQLKYDLREIFARCKDVFYALEQPTPAGLADNN